MLWSQKLPYELHEDFYAASDLQALIPDWQKAQVFSQLEANAIFLDDVKLDNPLPLAHDRDDDYLVALARGNDRLIWPHLRRK